MGDYTGQLGGDGYLRGTTVDLNTDNGRVGWISSRTFNSMYELYFTPGDCDFRQVTAKLEVGGIVRYDVVGTCLNQPMTRKMLYSDGDIKRDGLMREEFYYNGVTLSSWATCPADPWVSGASCRHPSINTTRGTGLSIDNYHVDFQRYPAPLSLRVISDPTIFQTALAKAPHPSPPAQPVNTKVSLDIRNRAVVSWLAPSEESPHGPYETFRVEGQQYQGGNWVGLGGVKRHRTTLMENNRGGMLTTGLGLLFRPEPAEYQLSVLIPTSRPGIVEGWKFRACTKTRFTKTCSDPMIPTPFGVKDRIQLNDPITLLSPPPGTTQSARVNGKPAVQTAPHLGGSDTLNTQKVLPTIQQPSAIPQSAPPKMVLRLSPSTSLGQNAVVNPQPLPPKPPTTTLNSSTSRIFLRGVPQEGSPPAGTTPVEPKPAP